MHRGGVAGFDLGAVRVAFEQIGDDEFVGELLGQLHRWLAGGIVARNECAEPGTALAARVVVVCTVIRTIGRIGGLVAGGLDVGARGVVVGSAAGGQEDGSCGDGGDRATGDHESPAGMTSRTTTTKLIASPGPMISPEPVSP